jgi:hypothetical protein
MRGRLIWPMLAEIAQLDTSATAADPDGAGPLTSGYDDDFREPVIVPPSSGSERGTVVRAESTVILPVQVEPDMMEQLQMLATGRSPLSLLRLVFHYRDLEAAGMVEAATGRPLLRINDRLEAIRDFHTSALIERIPNPPGLYATQVQSRSFGLDSLKRNLLLVTFEERAVSERSVG